MLVTNADNTSARSQGPDAASTVLAFTGITLPTLLAYNAPPSSTFYNQVLALLGWGVLGGWFIWRHGAGAKRAMRPSGPVTALIAALALLGMAALLSPAWTGLPLSLSLGSTAVVAVAVLVVVVGEQVGRGCGSDTAFRVVCAALALAGLASFAIALIQVFAPSLTDGVFLATSGIPGRAVGNVRQPNHLSTLLLLACAAVVWWGSASSSSGQRPDRRNNLEAVVLVGLIWGVVLTGSRTGWLGVAMLAAWGLLDRQLPRSLRMALIAAPVIYLIFWGAMSMWAHASAHSFGRVDSSDISNSRFGIWANTLMLISMHPWTGVGFGELNFAWTLTPFPGRPVAFFDHTHNIVLQFIAELGIPLALLVLGLLGGGLYGLVQRVRKGAAGRPDTERAALFMVLLAGVHSMLEYPLWYSYFLLPVMFAWGLALAPASLPSGEEQAAAPPRRHFGLLAIGGIVLALGSLYAVWDYQRVVAIYAPARNAGPLSERIARGQSSTFFSHQGDYAAATTEEHPGEAVEAFERAAHNLIDARLLRGWAEAEAELGHIDRARYLAHRLREFRHPLGDELFAVCDGSAESVQKYFQCGPDPTNLTFEDFRRPRK